MFADIQMLYMTSRSNPETLLESLVEFYKREK